MMVKRALGKNRSKGNGDLIHLGRRSNQANMEFGRKMGVRRRSTI